MTRGQGDSLARNGDRKRSTMTLASSVDENGQIRLENMAKFYETVMPWEDCIVFAVDIGEDGRLGCEKW